MRTKNSLVLVGALLSAFALTSCAPASTPGPTPSSTSASVATPTATPTAQAPEVSEESEATALPTAGSISCESMIDAGTREALEARDFSPYPKPYGTAIGELLGVGLACPWGVEGAMEPAAYYGWSAITAEEREALLTVMRTDSEVSVTEDERGVWFTVLAGPSRNVTLVADIFIATAPDADLIDAIVWVR